MILCVHLTLPLVPGAAVPPLPHPDAMPEHVGDTRKEETRRTRV